MPKSSAKSLYPDDYGRQVPGALPDVLGPLNVDNEGDKLVPPNDIRELAPPFVEGTSLPDPLDLVYQIEKDGSKGTGKRGK
jgi:hypothetical protein